MPALPDTPAAPPRHARFPLTPEDRYAVLGRLMHSLALYATLEAAHIGADLHLLADLRPATQRHLMAQAAVTTLYATPAQLKLLLRAEATPLPALRRIICGGGFLDADLRAAGAHRHAGQPQALCALARQRLEAERAPGASGQFAGHVAAVSNRRISLFGVSCHQSFWRHFGGRHGSG